MSTSATQAATLGTLLKRYRLAAGLTQEELAERAQVGVRCIGDLERGVPRQPRKDTLRLLTDALQLPLEERTALLDAARARRTAPDAFPPPASSSHNLPAVLTALIGREAEVASVRGLLERAEVRLLTLCGPPGVGKTRLALQVAAELLDHFSGGVYFVSLAPIRDPGLVAVTIAQVLGLRDASAQGPLAALHAHLRDKHLLLVLDNFEHLAAAAPEVADLLATSPGLKVLATSRAPLHLRGERQVPVVPLALPNPARLPPLGELSQIASVALFVERSQSIVPDFMLAPENAPAIAAICQRLDGLPLALELAAARIQLLPPQALLARLEHRLPLLSGGASDLPARQQTLRKTLDWSYDLLSSEEQALFRRLSVFVGGCSLEAADAVCLAAGDLSLDVLSGVTVLLDQHLLRREPGVEGIQDAAGEPRVGMLETIREYAHERLVAVGEAPAAERAYAAYYVSLAEKAEPRLKGPDQGEWLMRLERDHDNLRATLQWAAIRDDDELGLRLATAVGRFWIMRGHLSEGRHWFELLLRQHERQPDAADASASSVSSATPERQARRAKALQGLSILTSFQGDFLRAKAIGEESLRLYRVLGDRLWIAHSLNNLALTLMHLDDFVGAAALLEESLSIKREIGDLHGIASALNNLGEVRLELGDYAAAFTLQQESLDRWRQLGDADSAARTLANLGDVELRQGHAERAAALLEESLELACALQGAENTAHALLGLGDVARAQGDVSHAATRYREALAVYGQMEAKDGVLHCLEALAALWCAQGQFEPATRLCGAATAWRERLAMLLGPVARSAVEQTAATARQALGDDAFRHTWTAGTLMSLEQATQGAGYSGDGSE